MGVRKTTYLLFGIKLNKEQSKVVSNGWSSDNKNLIKYLEGCPEVDSWTLIYDGYCGKDNFFGKVCECINEYDTESYRVMEDVIEKCKDFEKNFKERFDDCFENVVELGDMKPKLMLINHFD